MDAKDIQAAEAKNIIAEDTEITGSIRCNAGIRIEGKVNGDLTCAAAAFIGRAAQVKGNIAAGAVVVHGQVTGNITAKERIDLKATARVFGDVKTRRMTVEDGVTLVGKADVNPGGARAEGEPAPAAAAEPAAEHGSDDSRRGPSFFGRK